MNSKATSVVIGLIVAAAIIGGIIWSKNKGQQPPAETTTYFPSTYPTVVTTPPPIVYTTTPSRQPGAPQATTKGISYVSQSSAVLNGEVNPNGAQTSYWYEYGTTTSLGSFTSSQLLGGGYLTYSAPHSVSGLKSNTTYYYRIVAQNQFGKVSGAVASFSTTTTPPPPYVAPNAETRSATNIGQNSATLNGVTNPNGTTTYYWFEFGDSPSLGRATTVGYAGAGRSNVAVSNTVSGLAPSTTYYFRLNAQNSYGTTNGSIFSFMTEPTTPPPPPKGSAPTAETNSATGVTQTSATLNGQVNPNGSQTNYYFEYGRATLLGIFTLDQRTESKSIGAGKDTSSVSESVAGLDPDSTYYFRIVAENSFGTTRGAIASFRTRNQ